MTQVYEPESVQAAAFSTPPRSSPLLFDQATTSNDENRDPTSRVPPGWEAFRDERNRLVYFNRSTGKMETSLEDLFKKPRSSEKRKTPPTTNSSDEDVDYPPNHLAPHFLNNGRVWSPSARPPNRPRQSPRPDEVESGGVPPFIVTPRERVTRVPGVVDLVSSGEEGRPETTDDDEETVLDGGLLPRTEEFDYNQHRGSDGGRDDDESDKNEDDQSDNRSAPLF
jgi:hypothetical protein